MQEMFEILLDFYEEFTSRGFLAESSGCALHCDRVSSCKFPAREGKGSWLSRLWSCLRAPAFTGSNVAFVRVHWNH